MTMLQKAPRRIKPMMQKFLEQMQKKPMAKAKKAEKSMALRILNAKNFR
jgi:hypothetical protein